MSNLKVRLRNLSLRILRRKQKKMVNTILSRLKMRIPL